MEKCIELLTVKNNRPSLVPSFRKPERNLLSVFMRLMELVPIVRGEILADCNFGAARSANYESHMEVSYPNKALSDGRPDGLIVCTRGTAVWSAFIEAKAGSNNIRTEQIQDYAKLASDLGVTAVISISNEFSRSTVELPYHLATNKKRKRDIFHFAWADLRNRLEFYRSDNRLSVLEKAILNDCIEYFWNTDSGITTYDAMPKDWPDFVQSSGIGVGFNSKTHGITEIVRGWHQERRDLRSKIMHANLMEVELRHKLGSRATSDEVLAYDRKKFAEEYILDGEYFIKDSRTKIELLCELRERKTTLSVDIALPAGKGARACITWLSKNTSELASPKTSISLDWKGRGNQRRLMLDEFRKDPESALSDSRDAPKRIRIVRQIHDVRRFKSRKNFVVDLEDLTLKTIRELHDSGLI